MAAGNVDDIIFSATLTPHRSLGRRGFLVLMAASSPGCSSRPASISGRSARGRSLGFGGLDLLAVWLAFQLNYRAARAYEEIEVSRTALAISKVNRERAAAGAALQSAMGAARGARRIAIRGVTRVAVRARDERVPVGAFLNPEDRKSFARAFGAALSEARR